MRRFFAHILLCIFVTGNALSEVRRDCGGKLGSDGETSGSLLYSFPAAVTSFHGVIPTRTVDVVPERPPGVCTWLIDATGNRSVIIEVLEIDRDARLTVKFGNDAAVREYRKGAAREAVFSGAGRTIVEWRWGNVEAPGKLHLRWNMSEDSHDLTQVPFTHSNNDPVSPSPEGTNVVTRTPDVLGFGILSSVKQGGGSYGPNDKSGPRFPQEGRHNGEETAAATISNLGRADTHSHNDAHTRSTLTYTHTDVSTVIQTDLESTLSGSAAQMSQPDAHTLDRDYPSATAAASTKQAGTHSAPITKSSPPTGTHPATEINSSPFNGVTSALLISALPQAGTHTAGPHRSVTDAEVSSPDRKVHDFRFATNISDITRSAAIEGVVSMVTANGERNQPDGITVSVTPGNRAVWTGTGSNNRSHRTTRTNQDVTSQTQVSDFSHTVATSHNQTNSFSEEESAGHSESTADPIMSTVLTDGQETASIRSSEQQTHTTYSIHTQQTETVSSLDFSTSHALHVISSEHTTNTQEETSSKSQLNTINQSNSAKAPTTHLSTDISTSLSLKTYTMRTDLPVSSTTSFETETEDGQNLSSTSFRSTVSQDGERDDVSAATLPFSSTLPTVFSTSQMYSTVIPDLRLHATVPTDAPNDTSEGESITATSYSYEPRKDTMSLSETQSFTQEQRTNLALTTNPEISPTHAHGTNSAILGFTPVTQTSHSGNDNILPNSADSLFTSSPMIPISNSPVVNSETGPSEVSHNVMEHTTWTNLNDPVTSMTSSPVVKLSSEVTTAGRGIWTSQTLQWGTSQTLGMRPTLTTTPQPKISPTLNLNLHHFTPESHTPVLPKEQPHTPTSTAFRKTHAATTSTPVAAWTSQPRPGITRPNHDRTHKIRVFVVEDQPAIIKEETFQVLLQIILDNSPSHVGLIEVEPFLHRVAGYLSQHVTWQSGPVVQAVVSFHTAEALSWLGRAESLLTEAGLNPLPREGLFLGKARVKNVTIGGLQSDICSWLFQCPSGFQCAFLAGNVSCRSVCHSEYCKHHGICIHHHGQRPLCQCPVGEDFWFMGPQCNLRMTRQRLIGLCFGILAGVAGLMVLLSYLAVRRFKSMLAQAKVEQTRSSYRRFNHFDELSARFWGRSWPGSEDSLDNPGFTRSDELLHLRALDRTCCYHDDTLSIASTYQGSATHLSTVYPHGSQYHWDLSNYSLADCVVDSGKASDLSVCSWPIEPIQWTPFPLLQQLSRNANSVRASRARSYCEGMELVDLERSWTA